MKLWTKVVFKIVVNLLISSEQRWRCSQFVNLFVSLVDDAADVSDDVVIKLDEVHCTKLDVGLIQISGTAVEAFKIIIFKINYHHLFVEILDRKTELKKIHSIILFQILQKGIQKISVLQNCRKINMKTGRFWLIVIMNKSKYKISLIHDLK